MINRGSPGRRSYRALARDASCRAFVNGVSDFCLTFGANELVGVDGSPASEATVREVASREWPPESEVCVIAVNDPLTPTLIGHVIPTVARTIEESNHADRKWLDKTLAKSAELLQRSALKISTVIREENPKRVLAEAAEEWSADCIFVGSVGFSNRLERFVLGSVSASVAARAHCSVEVVRERKTKGGSHERHLDYSRN